MSNKKLVRSINDRMVSGVFGGLADYLNIDPTIVRVVGALLILSNIPVGVVVYILFAIFMPEAYTGEGVSSNGFSEEEIIVEKS